MDHEVVDVNEQSPIQTVCPQIATERIGPDEWEQ